MFDNNAGYLDLHARMKQVERDVAMGRPLSRRRDDERIVHKQRRAPRRARTFWFDAHNDIAVVRG